MKEEYDFLTQMFNAVSKAIGKSFSAIAPFEQQYSCLYSRLRKNWYDTPQAIKNITDQQFQKMGVPLRVVAAIREEVNRILGKCNQPIVSDVKNQSLQNKALSMNKANFEQKSNKSQLNEAKIMQIVQKFENQLLQKYPWVGNQLLKIIQTVYKIIKNIVSDSYELKFRVLKKSNQKIKQIILANEPVVTFLKEIGFEEDFQKFFLDTFDTHALFFVEECLFEVLNNHNQQNEQQNQHFQKIGQKQEKREDFFLPVDIKLPQNANSVSLQSAFSKESLDEANYAEMLDKLMQFRRKIMSTAPKNRQIKIYHKRYEIKQTDFAIIDMQAQMTQSDETILAKYWKDIVKNSQNKAKFQSRRKTEFQYLIQQQVYREATIKLRLPNQFIIQARFGPLQTLAQVHKLVSQIVIGQFYIYQAPPVKSLQKEMHKTLDSLDSVPSGNFYIGLRTEWYIKNEYVKMIRQ